MRERMCGRLPMSVGSRSMKGREMSLCIRFAVVSLVAVSLFAGGCRRPVATPEAQPWLPVERDPIELSPPEPYWPMFRGANAQGIAAEARPPVSFSRQHNLRWEVELPGEGNSSPVVWGDRIFVTTAVGPRSQAIGYVLALRRSDGALLWEREVGRIEGKTHPKNGYASASPATDGQRVVAFLGSAGLVCYDFQGQLLWKKDLGPQEHIYGVAASPVIVDDVVIQLCDRERDSFLIALDKHTGKEIWRTPRSSTGAWTTPVVVGEKGGYRFLVVNGGEVGRSGRLAAYDLATGRELWYRDDLETLVAPVALLRGESLFSLSGRNGPIIALRWDARKPEAPPQLVWRLPRGGPYIPSALLYRNRLYVLSDLRWLTCYNPGNGQVIWRNALEGEFTASLVAADGRIYAVNERGVVFVVQAADEYRLLAKNAVGGRCLATPALVENDLILRTADRLYCFAEVPRSPVSAVGGRQSRDTQRASSRDAAAAASGPEDRGGTAGSPGAGGGASPASPESSVVEVLAGDEWPVFRGTLSATGLVRGRLRKRPSQRWIFTAENDSFVATPVVGNGTVYLGSENGLFFAVDLQTGKERWRWQSPAGIVAPAGYHEGRVYVGDVNGGFHCLDAVTGSVVWQMEAGAEIDGGPSFARLSSGRSVVIFGSQDTYLYCVEADSGKPVWKAGGQDQIRCTPPVVQGRTFVAGCDGKLHILTVEEGREVGAIDLEGPTGCTPAVVGSLAYVGTENGVFFALDWEKNVVRWRFEGTESSSAFRSSAALNERYVVVGCRDRKVHCFDRALGKHLWEFTTRRYVDSSPVIIRSGDGNEPADDVVLVTSLDGRLYALRIGDGRVLWEIAVGGAISSSPVVLQDRVLVATEDGDLLCYADGDG